MYFYKEDGNMSYLDEEEFMGVNRGGRSYGHGSGEEGCGPVFVVIIVFYPEIISTGFLLMFLIFVLWYNVVIQGNRSSGSSN